MNKRFTSTGRSMIEMLGVLAIIGVLSIGALAGYRTVMNKHRANETIHDVMLRAANVPMQYQNYQNMEEGHAFKFPELNDETSTMGYTLNTVKTDEYGYTYKVEGVAIPKSVCNKILQLEPTDIDEMRIGSSKKAYRRGLWDLCEDTSSENVVMSFYFEKECKTDAQCSDCQECKKGVCKANYGLAGCAVNDKEGFEEEPKGCIGDCNEYNECVGKCCIGNDCNEDLTCKGSDCCIGRDCNERGECTGADCCVGSDCADGGCVGSDCCFGAGCGGVQKGNR